MYKKLNITILFDHYYETCRIRFNYSRNKDYSILSSYSSPYYVAALLLLITSHSCHADAVEQIVLAARPLQLLRCVITQRIASYFHHLFIHQLQHSGD